MTNKGLASHQGEKTHTKLFPATETRDSTCTSILSNEWENAGKQVVVCSVLHLVG